MGNAAEAGPEDLVHERIDRVADGDLPFVWWLGNVRERHCAVHRTQQHIVFAKERLPLQPHPMALLVEYEPVTMRQRHTTQHARPFAVFGAARGQIDLGGGALGIGMLGRGGRGQQDVKVSGDVLHRDVG